MSNVVTLREVASRAGVSRSAVSRTFTPGASVSLKTREKVERAALELGYSPNALASSLKTGRTKLIGLVLNNFHNPLFLEVFDQFTRGLQAEGLRPLMVNLTDETDPQNSVQMMRQYSVDGVVVASSTLPLSFARAFRDAGVPSSTVLANILLPRRFMWPGSTMWSADGWRRGPLSNVDIGRSGFLAGRRRQPRRRIVLKASVRTVQTS